MFSFSRDKFKISFSIESEAELKSGLIRLELKRATERTLNLMPLDVLVTKLIRPIPYTMGVYVVDEKTMRKLNKFYRKKDKTTDVLAFSRLEGVQMPFPEIGDIIICLPVAKAQANKAKIPLEMELRMLAIHGILHLFGYDHEKTKTEAKRMFSLQNQIVASFTKRA